MRQYAAQNLYQYYVQQLININHLVDHQSLSFSLFLISFIFWKCAFARRRRYWNGYCIWITATNIGKGYVNGCNSWYKLFIVANDLFCNTGFTTTNSLNKTSRSKFKWSANGFTESKFKNVSLSGHNDDILDKKCKFFDENRSFNSTNILSINW